MKTFDNLSQGDVVYEVYKAYNPNEIKIIEHVVSSIHHINVEYSICGSFRTNDYEEYKVDLLKITYADGTIHKLSIDPTYDGSAYNKTCLPGGHGTKYLIATSKKEAVDYAVDMLNKHIILEQKNIEQSRKNIDLFVDRIKTISDI